MDLLNISPIRLLSTESFDSSIYEGKEDASSLDISLYGNVTNSSNCTPIITKKNLDDVQKFQDIESQISEAKRTYTNRTNSPKNVRKRFGSSLSSVGDYLSSNKTKFYKQKLAVYNFLQRPRSLLAVGYHTFVSCAIFVCLVLNVLSTVEEYKVAASNGLRFLDILVVVLFGTEFVARFWSSSCLAQYRDCNGKFRFLCNPFRVFDIFVITVSSIVLFFDFEGQILSTFLKGLRFFLVFGMFRLEHRFKPWRLMASVVWDQREHLAITAYMGFLSLLFVSLIVYFAEKDVNPDFKSLANALWWGVVTLCTVGYGEITPITSVGKFLSCICIILGVSLFALPAGILGAGLALKVEEQQHKRQVNKRREPAAKLIQSSWRFYLVTRNPINAIIWKRHLVPNTKLNFLTNRQKNAIKFILIIRFLVMRRRFDTASKPYSIKDVLEQYAAGHADVSARVKHMQYKTNSVQSVVNSNSKTLQESKVIISSHMSKIESRIYDLQLSLDQLTEIIKDNSTIRGMTTISYDNKNNYNNPSLRLFKPSSLRRKSS